MQPDAALPQTTANFNSAQNMRASWTIQTMDTEKPVQASTAILIQGTEALFGTGKLVLKFAFDMLLLTFYHPLRAFWLKSPAHCVSCMQYLSLAANCIAMRSCCSCL
jgi:hypothetical protein